MADLQDEQHAPAEAGELDEPPGAAAAPRVCAPEPPGRAHALLAQHPVADGYSGLPRALRGLPWYDLENGEAAVQTDIPRLRAGGVGALLWSLHIPPGQGAVAALEETDLIDQVVARYPEGLRRVRSAAQTAEARSQGRIAVLLGPAPAVAAEDSMAVLRALHALGLYVLTLTGTSWADTGGLTRFGEKVVREMNRLGMLADLTGAAPRTARDALAVSDAPVLLTRSGARALNRHPDNVSDDLLRRLRAARGICLVPCSADRTGPTLRDVADHLDHVRRVAGPETVGLAGMYDTEDAHPEGLTDVSGYPRLITELLARGWPESDIARLTWGNMERVLRDADATARALRRRRAPSTATAEGDRPRR